MVDTQYGAPREQLAQPPSLVAQDLPAFRRQVGRYQLRLLHREVPLRRRQYEQLAPGFFEEDRLVSVRKLTIFGGFNVFGL